MRIISLINDHDVIADILRCLDIGEDPTIESGRDPPKERVSAKPLSITYEPIYDDFQNMPEEYPSHETLQ
jgi:hypothetical protein